MGLYGAIHEANEGVVARIWADFGSRNSVRMGTAFAVTADGKLITNRHVVAGADGTQRRCVSMSQKEIAP